MKKILSFIVAAAAGLLAFSCTHEQLATIDDSLAVAPVIESYLMTDKGLDVTFTPGSFNQNFNQSMPVNHSLVIVSVNGQPALRVLSSTINGKVISASNTSINRGLNALGFNEGDKVDLEIAVRASMQDPTKDNGRNGFLESVGRAVVKGYEVTVPAGNPWGDYSEVSPWALIGSIASTGNSWNADEAAYMTPDGNLHVVRNIKLATGDQFKWRKDGGWDVNFGAPGEEEPYVLTLDTPIEATPNGKNLAVPADGNYDVQLNTADGTITIFEAFQTYPGYDQASDWTVIGAIASFSMNWDKDIKMISDGTWHVAEGVVLTADDQFKFRKDLAWTDNVGAEGDTEPFVCELDKEYTGAANGKNLAVPANGTYDLLLNPETKAFKVVESLGGKSGLAGSDTPEPPAPAGWGIIGDFNGWGGDVAMSEDNGVWTGFFTNADKEDGSHGAFKVRKDADWAENYGAPGDEEPVEVTLGEAMPVVAGGKNFSSPAGLYRVVLNLTDESNPTLTVSSADIYSLIGVINGTSWDTDFELAEADGVYTSDVVYIGGGFKIRHNQSWADADTYGAEGEVTVGTAFTAVQPGSDITVPEGNYRVQFTPATKEVLITAVDYELPEIDLSQFEVLDVMAGAETWGIVGPAVTGWETDYDLNKIQDDPEIWAAMNVPFQAGEFKFRGNDDWADYDLGGGTFALNTPIVMTKGGGNMTAERGVYTVYLYPTYGVAYITEGSGDVPPPPAKPEVWSLIGTINGTAWDTDFDLENTSGDVWKIRNVAISESDEFKLRANHDWNVNVGGPEENDVSTIEEGNPYGVYKPAIGTAFEAGGKNIRIGAAGNYDITFDYAANTILIEEYKEFADHLYMIGEAIGGWEWNADYIVDMIPVINNEWGGDATGQFYAIKWLPAGQGFKFCTKKAWDGDFWGLKVNEGFVEVGGNCTVVEDGLYLIHIDLKNEKVHVEPAAIYGIGECFGNKWDEEMSDALFTVKGKKAVITLPNDGTVRAYVSSRNSTSSWWTREFNIIDGKIAYRTGDELAWPKAKAGEIVTFDFGNGTGSISAEGEDDFDYTPSEEYSAAGNLWKPVDEAKAQRYFFSVNPDWAGQIYSGFGNDLPPYLEFDQSTYKLTFEKATTGRWQNQIFIHPQEGHFIPLDASKTYKFSVTAMSTNAFDAFFKLVQYDAGKDNREGATIVEPAGDSVPSNVIFEAGTPVKIEFEISGVSAENINVFFDLGGNPENTVVYIKDITLVEK